MKWYRLHRPEQIVDPAVEDEARAFLTAEIRAARLPISGDLGFAIHHLSGDHVHLLLVCTWRNDNEMWETTYVKDVRLGGPFALMPQTAHRGVSCVWELGPVAHEHHAWTRYLHSDRDPADKQAYVESRYSGPDHPHDTGTQPYRTGRPRSPRLGTIKKVTGSKRSARTMVEHQDDESTVIGTVLAPSPTPVVPRNWR